MSNIIKLLPENISNQIAAGEVVQRPSSVVKELLENAIDAGASEITVNIKKAGKSLIQIIDNGKGMSSGDAKMCFQKYATSKISITEDLYRINTLGFRGEALASIAAVSQVELTTNENSDDIGTKILIEGSEIKLSTPEAKTRGTTVSVKNLFYNIPARRRFLKTDGVETKHIIDEFQRIALSKYNISFYLFFDGNEMYHLPKSKLSHRVVNIFGKHYKKQLILCEEKIDDITIYGYIGRPENAKKTRGEQFFYVNNRYIKNPYLHHAIKKSYENLIQDSYFPFYILFIEINPNFIDVNVHPTKTEIKFENEKLVYSVLKSAIQKAIATHHLTPSIDFDQNINSSTMQIIEETIHSSLPSKPNRHSHQVNNDYINFKSYDKKAKKYDWNNFFEEISSNKYSSESNQSSIIKLNSTVNKQDEQDFILSKDKIQIHQKYIIAQIKSGILIIDQRAAQEKIFYEKYVTTNASIVNTSQQLMFPTKITLSKSDILIIKECIKELERLGFKIDFIKNESLKVLACPNDILNHDLQSFFESFIEQYKNNEDIKIDKQKFLANIIAKRLSMMTIKILEKDEMSAIIDQIFACKNPQYTSDGKLVFIIKDLQDISNFFKN